MSTTHDPIAHAARLLREAAQELKYAHTIGGIAEWDGTEPEVQAVYDEHMAAAEAIEEWESAVGAGGVGPLRKRDDSMVRKADVIARLEQGFGAGSAVVMTIKHFFSNELPRQELQKSAEPSRECLQQSASISYAPFPSDPEQLAALAKQLLSFYADCLESDGRPATAGEARLLGDAVLAALQAAPPAPAGVAVPPLANRVRPTDAAMAAQQEVGAA